MTGMETSRARSRSSSIKALDLCNFEQSCNKYLSCNAPNIKWALLSFEVLAQECKCMTDINGVEYDTHPLFRFLTELQMTIPMELDHISMRTKMKYFYFKKKLLVILRDNLFSEYVDQVRNRLTSLESTSSKEAVLERLIKVHEVLHVDPDLSNADMHQYEFMAEVLKLCYEEDVQDSRLFVSLLKLTVDMRSIELSDARLVNQPCYPNDFYKYVLRHANRERFDLASYCADHSRTLWEYSRIFSVVGAISFGNAERTLCLLQHGFDAFSKSEAWRTGHGYPDIKETMPPTYAMILHLMSNMRSMNIFLLNVTDTTDDRYYGVTDDQRECFQLIWRTIPDSFAKVGDISPAITTEYFHLARHGILNPLRYEKSTKFSIMYEVCFPEMSSGPREPRSLQHLSRCAVRKTLKTAWRLPDGIFQLGLPSRLERYLNLEID